MADYIGKTDAGKLTFGQNAVALITPANATTWSLTPAIATQLATYVSDYGTKLAAATEPATKSRANTFAKNQSRDTMVAYIRQAVVPPVQGSAVVTDQMRHDLGITIKGANPPSPINPPQEAPIVDVLWVKNRLIGVQLRRPESDSRGKPPSAQGCSVCMYSGPLPLPTDVTQWVTIGESSRNKFEIELPSRHHRRRCAAAGLKTEVRGQKSEVRKNRGQKSDVRAYLSLISDL
jgi:hypothetical protein